MKKTLSIILSFVMLFTSVAGMFTGAFSVSALTAVKEVTFENYDIGANVMNGATVQQNQVGEVKLYQSTANAEGWTTHQYGSNYPVVTKATTENANNKAMQKHL